MGYFPYTQMCIHGHKWGASASSYNGWRDDGKDSCPECGCKRLGRVEGHAFVEKLQWEPVDYKGICEHDSIN